MISNSFEGRQFIDSKFDFFESVRQKRSKIIWALGTFEEGIKIIFAKGGGVFQLVSQSRGRSTSAPELSSYVALAPPSNGVGTSEELIEHIRLE